MICWFDVKKLLINKRCFHKSFLIRVIYISCSYIYISTTMRIAYDRKIIYIYIYQSTIPTYIPLINRGKLSDMVCGYGCWCFLVENKAVAGCYTSAYEMYFWFIWWLFQQGIESAFGVWKITTWVKIIIWNSLGFRCNTTTIHHKLL